MLKWGLTNNRLHIHDICIYHVIVFFGSRGGDGPWSAPDRRRESMNRPLYRFYSLPFSVIFVSPLVRRQLDDKPFKACSKFCGAWFWNSFLLSVIYLRASICVYLEVDQLAGVFAKIPQKWREECKTLWSSHYSSCQTLEVVLRNTSTLLETPLPLSSRRRKSRLRSYRSFKNRYPLVP